MRDESRSGSGEASRQLHAPRSRAVRSSFPPFVLRGETKRQNWIGSRDLSAAISGAEVGQAERNGGRASHAARGICFPVRTLRKSSACLKFIIGGQGWEIGQRHGGTAHPIWGKTFVNTEALNTHAVSRKSARF